MNRIAFIVPTFNRERYLGEALAAIIAQMREGDEVLVVDDGSTDGTATIAAAAGPRVRYLRQDNAGKSAALNRGLAATDAPLVWICDDDDVLRDGAVASLAAAMADEAVDFAFGRYTRFRTRADGSREDLGTGYWPDLATGSLARHMLEDAFVMQNAALVRRTAYQAVGPFSTAMPRSLDYEMFVRLAVSQRVVYVDRLMFDQRKHDGARGPAALQHAVTRSDEVWWRFDRMIFAHLYPLVPIGFFAEMYEGADAQRRGRAGLLCRAAILLRHGCWEEAAADLGAAAALPLPPLEPAEIAICRRAFAGKHGFADLLGEGAVLARLAELARARHGGQILQAMLAGTVWRIRRGEPGERRITFALIWRLLGWRAIALLRVRGTAPAGAPLVERADPSLLDPRVLPPVSRAAEGAMG